MSGEGDSERLIVLVEARIRDLEKNMAKASGIATKTFAGMRLDSRTATQRMEADMMRSTSSINRMLSATSSRIGSFGVGISRGAIAALAPLIGMTAAINGAKAALSEFGDIADNSKAAGIDAEMFQGLAYQAEMGGVSIDTLATSLAGFNRNAGLAVENKGRMVAALKALNPELLANIQAATTQEERIRLAADAIAEEGDEAKRAALSVALFGDAGAKLADVFSGGAAAIAETSAKAKELGLIVENDLIARADEMGDKFDTATKIMDLQFKQALIDLAPFLISTAKLAGDLARAINYMSESMQALSDRSTARLEQDYQGIMATLGEANAEYAPGVVGNMGVQIDPQQQADMQAQADAMRAELKRRALAKLATDLNAPKPGLGGDNGDADVGGRNAAADAAIREAEAVTALIANLQHEQSLIGLSAVEQAKLNALREAGAAATDEQRAQIAALVEQTYEEQARIEMLADSFDMLGDLGLSAVNGIIDALEDGKIEADEFGDILSSVLGMAGQFFLNKAFGGFGSMFGFSDGGYTGPGGKHQPAGVVHKGEVVWSQRDVARAGGVGAVEGMRRGMRGYADGGAIPAPSAYMPAPSSATAQTINFAPVTSISVGEGSNVSAAEIKKLLDERDRKMLDRMPSIFNSIQANPRRAFVGGR